VGGTNPSLLEAMACGCNIASHDNCFNREILEADASYFSSPETVRDLLEAAIPAAILRRREEWNKEKILKRYNWEKIIGQYERLFIENVAALIQKKV
jgi:glycosyltransferase involved in cell wall biosynthesis